MQGDGEINALFSGIKGAQTPWGPHLRCNFVAHFKTLYGDVFVVLGWVMYFSVGKVHVFSLLYLDRRAGSSGFPGLFHCD